MKQRARKAQVRSNRDRPESVERARASMRPSKQHSRASACWRAGARLTAVRPSAGDGVRADLPQQSTTARKSRQSKIGAPLPCPFARPQSFPRSFKIIPTMELIKN